MRFEFATAGRILFGRGVLKESGQLARSMGRVALLVTGANVQRSEPLQKFLNESGVAFELFSVTGEPRLSDVTNGVRLGREHGCELVVAIGGGSVLDAGKAIAALITNDGELSDYLEVIGSGKPLTKAPLPFIAIPTTAGTGTEATRNAVLASPQHRVKVSLRSPLMLPKVALIDPDLTAELPQHLTASTGMDALTQLIEPYTCNRSNPMTDALCVDGMRLVARSLQRAFNNGNDMDARQDMSLAALYSGIALANAGLGAVHGFAAPIGGMFPAPHGSVCAALLPNVMKMNIHALRLRAPNSPILGRYDEIARILTGRQQADADAGADWVQGLSRQLGIPPLRIYGVTPEDFPALIEKAARASSMKANPIELKADELMQILQASW